MIWERNVEKRASTQEEGIRRVLFAGQPLPQGRETKTFIKEKVGAGGTTPYSAGPAPSSTDYVSDY